ncbi:MAG: hypothetical protein EOO20_16100 [Chryseobacterium sp.]|nr:MAG: hypothetical protein EOO20_16100 [Chryseobacterium sp.]
MKNKNTGSDLPPNWPPVPPSGKPFIYGLDQPEVIDFYNKNFIMYKTAVGDSIAGLFSRKYQLTRFPAFIFEDNKGYLLTKSTSGAPIAQPYLSMANEAIAKLKSGKTIGSFK